MKIETYNTYIEILKNELKPAMGWHGAYCHRTCFSEVQRNSGKNSAKNYRNM